MTDEIDYRKAGVDIEAGEEAVERIKAHARSTFRPEVLQGLGGFSGLFAPDLKGIKAPVLVAGSDGVGTKLKLAFAAGKHDTIGIDCVAMCVNDILVQGAEPLFFLDYLAVGKLLPAQVEDIVAGVAEGCRQAGCALLGGETAEMPGFYPPGEYDLAGFAVGMVDRSKLVDGSAITAGNVLVGLASNGLHSNGYSLARKVLLEEAGLLLSDPQPGLGHTLSEEMLKPTTIYVKPVLEALKKFPIKGMAHITGGGLPGNLPRILPEGLQVEIDSATWPEPAIFQMIKELGPVRSEEMFRAFNMGIGFCIIVDSGESAELIKHFSGQGILAYQIGVVKPGIEGAVIN
ncbi:MAG: phosphoribosylformylglycinamidine cyclo-ligase [Dethiobacteria bacterium]|nr:phosphoribosylformylglycinamidine cyclo-ligase [Dethiobacteria bacterium]